MNVKFDDKSLPSIKEAIKGSRNNKTKEARHDKTQALLSWKYMGRKTKLR